MEIDLQWGCIKRYSKVMQDAFCKRTIRIRNEDKATKMVL